MVALLISDLPDDLIWGEVPVARGLVAIGTITFLHTLVAMGSCYSVRFDRLVGSGPKPVLRDGAPVRATLSQQRISDEDLDAMLRECEVDERGEIEQALLEPSGEMTVRRRPEAKPAQKGDLP
jgi:uncharacterized membrane protein YcaP (DUF421 family)